MYRIPCHVLVLLLSLAVAALQLACGPLPAPASDAGTAVDAGPGDAGDDPDATKGCPNADPVVQALASTSSVTFEVTNQGANTVYLVTSGWFCDAYAITTTSGSALPQQVGFNCGCECPNPGAPEASGFVTLEPGQSHSVTWDARRLVTYNSPVDCAAQGWGDFCADAVAGARQPVAQGPYAARFGYVEAIPEGCSDDGSGQIFCHGGPTPGGYPYDFPGSIQQICPHVQTVEASFELTADSTQQVEVLRGEPVDASE